MSDLTQPPPRGGVEDVTLAIVDSLERAAKAQDILGSVLHAQAFRDLAERIKERRALGLKKYGTSLMTWNGRDPYADAIEEELDRLQYLTQARMERADLMEQIHTLQGQVNRLKELKESAEHQASHFMGQREKAGVEVRQALDLLTERRYEGTDVRGAIIEKLFNALMYLP